MKHLRRSSSLRCALALAPILVVLSGPAAHACDPLPGPDGSQDVLFGTVEYGSNNGTGGHAGYVAPGGGAYTFVGGNSSGAQIWAGAAGYDAFVGIGPGYSNLNEICVS